MVHDRNPLYHPRYRRSNAYDPQWIFANLMGPHPLWLVEALVESLPIEPGMRVLDLGCGTALTSIFLAKEFGARVWATDLWVDSSANEKRIAAAGVEDLVVPVHAEAHALPFESDFFDVVVSVDAYHYFGTADLYVGYLVDFLRTSGRVGIVVPGLTHELEDRVPDELSPHWEWDFCSFHTPAWWAFHWEKSGKVRVDVADGIEDGWRDWLQFDEATASHTQGWRREGAVKSAAMLHADQGKNLCFSRVVATKE